MTLELLSAPLHPNTDAITSNVVIITQQEKSYCLLGYNNKKIKENHQPPSNLSSDNGILLGHEYNL